MLHPLLVLLNVAAAVMLLLWAARMVRTGMERAFGAALREHLRKPGGGLVGMSAVGAVTAVLLQSATAVGVLAAGFVSAGMLTVGAGLAALLGADLGSALVVRVLALDLSALIPVFVFVGTLLFLKSERRQVRQYGRITLGIGFILVSLAMIGEATEPLRGGQALPVVIRYLEGDPLTAFVAVAALTWAMHSSVAMVLLLAMLTQGGLLPMQAAVPMLMGANFGAGLIAVWLSRGMSAQARRVPLGNQILRGASAVAALLAFWLIRPDLDWLGSRPEVQLVHLHLLFNAAMLVLALPLVPAVARLCALLLPEPATPAADRRSRISALDRTVTDRPALALASATRELLAMGDAVIEMFTPVTNVLSDPSAERIAALRQSVAAVGACHAEIKLYLAEVNRHGLCEGHRRRSVELTDLAINLERTCDIIARSILPLADEKRRRGLRFSDAGWADIRSLHARVRTNLQLAMNVLVSGDVTSARDLMREKERIRQFERESLDRHLRRLSEGNPDSIATSHMHVQAIRAFKEINSLLVTVTHPILAERGMILDSRLAPANVSGH